MSRKRPSTASRRSATRSPGRRRTETEKRAYDSPLRAAQADQTRQRILDAAYEALQTTPLHDLSYATLAASLGISTRTLYRHFPDKSELVGAVAERHIARLLGDAFPDDLPGAAALLRRMHRMLDEEPGTYRLFFHLPVRSQGGVQRLVESLWKDVLSGLPKADRPAAAGLFELFMGPYAYDVLHENWGLSASDTTRVCLAALDLIAEGLERDPGALSRKRSVPARFESPEGAE